jgi:hypothetical protein
MIGMKMSLGLGKGQVGSPEPTTTAEPMEQVATPEMSITGMFPKKLTIVCATPGVTIYWNLNAPSDPDESSSLYAGKTDVSFLAGWENIIKARAYKDGMLPSEVGVRIVNT